MKMLRKIAKYVLLFLSVLAVVGLLLSYLSSFISPAKFWPIAFFGLFFQLFLIVNLLLCIVWLCFRKKFCLVHLAVMLLGIPYIGSFIQFGGGAKAEEGQKQLKIVSYNVHIFNAISKKNSYREVADFLNKEKADIICLQEFCVYDNKQPTEAEFDKLLIKMPYHCIFYNIAKRGSRFGLAIFSRYPIVDKGEFRFTHTANAALYADINVEGKTIRVYNNHLQSTKFNFTKTLSRFSKEDERIDELLDVSSMIKSAFIKRAEQVNKISAHVKESPFPAIVCGDFNDTPVSYTYRTMRGKLKDSFITAGSGMPSTYRGFFPSFRIDYIFHDECMKAVGYKVEKITLSDHYPVITTLAL